jgi:hypothetical protein
MKLAVPSLKDQGYDGLGVIPPGFFRNATKELKDRDYAGEHRLGSLKGKSQDERIVQVGLSRRQDRDNGPSIGKINMDMAGIGLKALAWKMF